MAGRIPQAFIDDLLARTDLAEVISARVPLKKAGRNWTACCPFHHEKTPSFNVIPDKQFYYCFGCQASGNALKFLMEHDHLEFVEAVEALARMQGMEVPREENRSTGQRLQEQQEKERQDARYRVMQQASHFYQQQLLTPAGQEAYHYLIEQRGLDASVIERFALGVAPAGWDELKNHLAAAHVPEALQLELGLLAQKEETGRVYDRFRERVIFPIRDLKGRVVAFGGRVLGEAKPKYLNSPETPLFQKSQTLYGLYEARQAAGRLDRLLVVEGYMDVVALAQQGIHWAVATLGTATTSAHLQQLFRLVNEVVFCFDGDRAGQQAARKALDAALPLMSDGQQARFLFLPQGEDPDSLVRHEGAGLFEQRVNQAQPLAEFLLRELRQDLDLNLLDDQAQLAQRARPPLAALPKGLLKRSLLRRLVQLTGLTEADLLDHAAPVRSPASIAPAAPSFAAQSTHGAASSVPAVSAPSASGSDAIEMRLIRQLLGAPSALQCLPDGWLMGLPATSRLKRLFQPLLAAPHLTTQVVLDYWAGTAEEEWLLAQWKASGDLGLPLAVREAEVLALVERYQQQQEEQQRETRYQQLMAASQAGAIGEAERQELWKLIQEAHQKKRAQ
ncbi:DNA primase [Marinospirillum sp. MEB164]|uniref:DNA primase n=1 Tax=Marinospirillum alkalitolerans TaxID=3123374 RepID=A0ABW8PW52_9GAMM